MSTVLEITAQDRYLAFFTKGLKTAEMEEQLTTNGPFTFFAPVNLAFNNLEDRNSENLLSIRHKVKLSDILSFHIVPEKKMLRDLRNGQKLRTLNGKELSVTVINNEVRINGAKILSRDKQASNGVIHSIDTVNIPS